MWFPIKLKGDVMVSPRIICGVEIELEYNKNKLSFFPNPYHYDGEPNFLNDFFIMERDGSLMPKFFKNGDVIEFISIPFDIEQGMDVIRSFRDYFRKFGELKKVINFNNTTGAHMHLSVLNADKFGLSPISFRGRTYSFFGTKILFREAVSIKLLNKIKSLLVREVKKKLPEVFPTWYRSLTRPYAQALDESCFYTDRRREWNLTLKNRVEFRAFNLRGVKTWSQFTKIYSILFKVIRKVIFAEFEKPRPFKSEFGFSVERTTPIILNENHAVRLLKPKRRRRYKVEVRDSGVII